jgi:hypothetical protein
LKINDVGHLLFNMASVPNAEKLETIRGIFDEPGHFREIIRTAGGLLTTRCVDRRLVDLGGAIRTPGNTLGTGTVLIMRGVAVSMRDAINKVPLLGLRRGAHRNVCAYDHNLLPVVGLVADQDPRVMELYHFLGERVMSQLPADQRVAVDEAVAQRAERALHVLDGHRPDEMIDYIADMPDSHVVTPQDPHEQAAAFVINTDPSAQVLDGHVAPDGLFYLDAHVKAVTHSAMPADYMPDALALSAATAVLVARAHDLPIMVAEGVAGQRSFTDFSVQ